MLFVAVGRAGAILAALPLHLQDILDFSGTIPEINFVHCELERCHHIFGFGIKVICNRNIADLILRKELLCVIAGFSHVTAQPGQVFCDDYIGFSGFQGTHHFLKSGTFKVAAGPTIVHKEFQNGDSIVIAIAFDDFLLIGNTGGFTLLGFFAG